MFVLDENPTFKREVPFDWPTGTKAWKREVIEVEFLLPDEARFQALVEGLKEEAESETKDALTEEVVQAVFRIGDKEGNELDPYTDGRTRAIQNPLLRRAIIRVFLQHIQKNTFRS